jgi:hypothetical protein
MPTASGFGISESYRSRRAPIDRFPLSTRPDPFLLKLGYQGDDACPMLLQDFAAMRPAAMNRSTLRLPLGDRGRAPPA